MKTKQIKAGHNVALHRNEHWVWRGQGAGTGTSDPAEREEASQALESAGILGLEPQLSGCSFTWSVGPRSANLVKCWAPTGITCARPHQLHRACSPSYPSPAAPDVPAAAAPEGPPLPSFLVHYFCQDSKTHPWQIPISDLIKYLWYLETQLVQYLKSILFSSGISQWMRNHIINISYWELYP